MSKCAPNPFYDGLDLIFLDKTIFVCARRPESLHEQLVDTGVLDDVCRIATKASVKMVPSLILLVVDIRPDVFL